jgi:hypothetical protein
MAEGTLSNLFKAEMAALNETKDKTKTGEAEITVVANNDTTTSISAEYDVPESATPKEREKLRSKVSRHMARKIAQDYKDNLTNLRGKTLETLALEIAGASGIGRKTSKKTVAYSLGESEDLTGTNLIETVGGKKRRASSLRALIQEIMRRYMTNDMTSPNAPLKFRTGRFVSSATVTSIKAHGNTVSLGFTYMVRPYSVFDPAVSSYNNLSSKGRNPRRIIGSALHNAARDVIHARYNFKMRQE